MDIDAMKFFWLQLEKKNLFGKVNIDNGNQPNINNFNLLNLLEVHPSRQTPIRFSRYNGKRIESRQTRQHGKFYRQNLFFFHILRKKEKRKISKLVQVEGVHIFIFHIVRNCAVHGREVINFTYQVDNQDISATSLFGI